MNAEQIYLVAFDRDFFALPKIAQNRIQSKIDEIGERLANYAHYRMTGSDEFRLRIGDYRVIYSFDLETNRIFLVALGHRREVYR